VRDPIDYLANKSDCQTCKTLALAMTLKTDSEMPDHDCNGSGNRRVTTFGEKSRFRSLSVDECNRLSTTVWQRQQSGKHRRNQLDFPSSQNLTNNLLGCTRSAAANLRMFSSERLRSPRSTSAA
jgi:hypothetical protein